MINRFAILLVLTSVLSSDLFYTEALAEADPPPNILFILADDLGWYDISANGNELVDTPNIDRLAEEGTRFTQAYAHPVCTPTRVSLVSGLVPERVRMYALDRPFLQPHGKLLEPANAPALDPTLTSIADLLATRGYRSTLIGKWHLGYGNTPWDEDSFEMPPRWENMKKERATFGFERSPEPTEGTNGKSSVWPELERWAEQNPHKNVGPITLQAAQFIEANQDGPFYACVSHFTVHTKIEARDDLVEKYRQRFATVEEPPMAAAYAAMVEVLDESVGLLLKHLEVLDLADNTMVVFYSDNGGQDSDGRSDFITTNGPLRENKGWPYEGGIRVPLIVSVPGAAQADVVADDLVGAEDFFYTFAEVAGAQLPNGHPQDGQSFLPILKGEEREDRQLYWYYPTGESPFAATRKGRHKLIELYEEQRLELYDLEKDLGETNNLAAERIDVTRELLSDLRSWQLSIKARLPSFNPRYDPARASEPAPRPEQPWMNSAGLKQTYGDAE